MKKKKSKSTYLVLTLLLLLVAGFTTYAIYKTSASGTANVSAANWVVKVTANGSTTNVTGGANNINLGTCQTHLAPGGSCTIPFTVDMTESEVDSILTVGIGNGINQDTLALMNEAGLSLKISDGTLEGYAYTLNYGTTKVLNLVIDWEAGLEDNDTKASADVALSKNLGTLNIPVNMTVRQFNGLTRTVTFNKNTEDSNVETPESVQVTDGGTISTIPDLNSENLIFVGWYTSPTGGVKLTSTTPIIENVTYYAQWRERKNLTVTFNTHDGSSVSSISVNEGSSLSSIPTSTKNGYDFVGWFTLEEGGTKLTTETIINSDITYHARWQFKTYTLSQEVYFDPTKVDQTKCNNTDHTGTTCMKWRVIEINDAASSSTIKLQLDHNLVNMTRWSKTSSSTDGPAKILEDLATETSGWTNVDDLNYSYDTSEYDNNYGSLSCTNGTCTITKTGAKIYNAKARLITGEEVAAITRTQTTSGNTVADAWAVSNSGWFYFSNINYPPGTTSGGNGNRNLSWLVENTSSDSSSGATNNSYGSNNYGYWTLSPCWSSARAFRVKNDGGLGDYSISDSNHAGARPVITIPKTKIQ